MNDAIRQNLIDAGCDKNFIAEFESCFDDPISESSAVQSKPNDAVKNKVSFTQMESIFF